MPPVSASPGERTFHRFRGPDSPSRTPPPTENPNPTVPTTSSALLERPLSDLIQLCAPLAASSVLRRCLSSSGSDTSLTKRATHLLPLVVLRKISYPYIYPYLSQRLE